MFSHRSITTLLGALLCVAFVACNAPTPGQQVPDFDFSSGGKADNANTEITAFSVPKINLAKRPSATASDYQGSHVYKFSFYAKGSFKVSLSQSGSPKAYVRIRINDADTEKKSLTKTAPSLEWNRTDSEKTKYTIYVINRSKTRTLENATLKMQVDLNFVAPSTRRTFGDNLTFTKHNNTVTVAFFDADSTLRISKSSTPQSVKPSPDGASDVMLLPGAIEAVKAAVSRGELVAIVSNQGGIQYGHITFGNAEAALAKTVELLAQQGANVSYFDFAESYYGNDRKPKKGMAQRLESKLQSAFGVQIDWSTSYMVGDAGWKKAKNSNPADLEPDGTPGIDHSNSDRLFAEALGIDFHHPRDLFGWVQIVDAETEVPFYKRLDYKSEVDNYLADLENL